MTPRQVDELRPEEYAAMWRLAVRESRELARAQRRAERKARG